MISNYNVDEFETIYAFVRDELKPDSFISEIAEERVELDTVGMGITPPIEKYRPVIERLPALMTLLSASVISGIVVLIFYGPFFIGHSLHAIVTALPLEPASPLARSCTVSGTGVSPK